MSIFKTVERPCPACEAPILFHVVRSVNAGRHPHLRDQILEDTFQEEACGACGAKLRIEPDFNYFDQPLGLWIHVLPASELGRWADHEQDARHVHAITFGLAAPEQVQALGAQLTPRLAFGWAGLREKVVARMNAIDDVTLELAKLALYRVGAVPRLADDVELRLAAVEPETLSFALLEGESEALLSFLEGPASALEDIEQAGEAWASAREALGAGYFVDVSRLLVESSPAEGFTGI
ncbi:MAG: hypothetical protein H6741_02160 [Alphaproteobacteria bacterium]|nr:hypothetical protein [Alphaproteobacteria bacterium]MCB9791507.1 hypothetical protein [Alphaproteobacteria bacterium]